jgi:hypothetical protein
MMQIKSGLLLYTCRCLPMKQSMKNDLQSHLLYEVKSMTYFTCHIPAALFRGR